MTTKTLGQVFYEQEAGWRWDAISKTSQQWYEKRAQAVAAVVREQCAHDADKDAARYRALRGSLTGKAGCSVTFMPRLLDPFDSMLTYTPDGLDKTLDDAIRSMKP